MIADRRDARELVMAQLRESEFLPTGDAKWDFQLALLRELADLVRADREEREAAE